MATTTSASSERRAEHGIEFFDDGDALDLIASGTMSVPELLTPGIAPESLAELAAGQIVKVLYRSEDIGASLVWSSFAPIFIIPRHSHSANCLYYVVRGEAQLGNRVVGAGGGFFVPADAPYGYRVGAEGLEILEFRDAVAFDMKVTESAARLEKILENSRQHAVAFAAHSDT